MDKVKEAQLLLYKWMGCFEKRKEVSIRMQCQFLNDSMELGISKPIWVLFYPLVYSGVADFAGNGYYALTSPLIVDCGDYVYTVNEGFNSSNALPVGYNQIKRHSITQNIKVIKPNTLAILKSMPCLKEVVDSWRDEIVSVKSLIFKDFTNKKGLADLDDGLKRYFCIPNENYTKLVPTREENPEGYNIAICYTRVLNKKANGVFDKEKGILMVESFAFPILLYRALLIEGLIKGLFPKVSQNKIYFFNINSVIIKELNRILNKSITEGNVGLITEDVVSLHKSNYDNKVEDCPNTPELDKKQQIDMANNTSIFDDATYGDIAIIKQNVTSIEFDKLRKYQTNEFQCCLNNKDLEDKYLELNLAGCFKARHIEKIRFESMGSSCIRTVQSITITTGRGEFSKMRYATVKLKER